MRARLLTHVDGAGERLALRQHGEPVAQVRHVVLRLQFVSVERFVTLMQTIISYLDPAKHAPNCYLPRGAGPDRKSILRNQWSFCRQHPSICGKELACCGMEPRRLPSRDRNGSTRWVSLSERGAYARERTRLTEALRRLLFCTRTALLSILLSNNYNSGPLKNYLSASLFQSSDTYRTLETACQA